MTPTIWKYIGLGITALVVIALIITTVRGCKQDERDAQNQVFNSGVITEREKSNSEALNAVQTSKNAVDNPTSNQLNVVCEKYDRNCR